MGTYLYFKKAANTTFYPSTPVFYYGYHRRNDSEDLIKKENSWLININTLYNALEDKLVFSYEKTEVFCVDPITAYLKRTYRLSYWRDIAPYDLRSDLELLLSWRIKNSRASLALPNSYFN